MNKFRKVILIFYCIIYFGESIYSHTPPKTICITGLVGAGKTIFASLLKEKIFEVDVLSEPAEKWLDVQGHGNLWDLFLNDAKRWALTSEIYIPLARIQALEQLMQKSSLPTIIIDRSIYEDRYVFAKMAYEQKALSDLEWAIYQEWFVWLTQHTVKPSGFIYLRAKPEVTLARMQLRGREEEKDFSLALQQKFYQCYEDLFINKLTIPNDIANIPVLVIDANENFKNNPEVQKKCLDQVNKFIEEINKNFEYSTQVPLIPRKILFGNPEKTYPQISPDGNKLAYCAPHNGIVNIWVKTIGKDDDKVITKETKRGICSGIRKNNYFWAPNGEQILYHQDLNGNENYHIFSINLTTNEIIDLTPFNGIKAEVIAIDKHISDKILIIMNKENPKLFDAYYLNLKTKTLTLAAKNPGNIICWCADSKLQIRAAVANHTDGTQELLFREQINESWRSILTLNFEDSLFDELYCGVLGFSQNGEKLYLNSSIGANTRRLISLNLKTRNYFVISEDPEYDLYWVMFNQDTYMPELACWQKERFVQKVLNPSIKQLIQTTKTISNGDLFYIQHSDDSKKWIFGFLYDNKSIDYYTYDCDSKQSTFLFYKFPEINKYQLATMEPISFTARDGLKVSGYITFPLDSNKQSVPLVLLVHGGPFYRDYWSLNPVVQWLSNRGYACLQVNFRGSSGYGKQFLAAGNHEWGGKMHDDLIDAVEWAIKNGFADKNHIAIYGGSYGGYAALVGATFTPDVFCCAIDECGPSNLITLLKTLPSYWSVSQWEKRIGNLRDEDFLKSRSPFYKIENIKNPILIAHGANDVRVPQTESDQIVSEMIKKGITCKYLLFLDEGHGFMRPENRFNFYQEAENFLSKYLGGRNEL